MSVLMVFSSPAGLGTLVTCDTFGLVATSPDGGTPAAWAGIADMSIAAATAIDGQPILRRVSTR